MRRLRTTPDRPLTVLIAQVIVLFAMTALGMLLLIAAGMLVFQVRFQGNVLSMLAGFFLSSLSFFGIGFILAGVMPNTRSAWLVGMLLLYPMLLLSGASRGIRHATVKRFSAAGWRVITISRQPFPEQCPWEHAVDRRPELVRHLGRHRDGGDELDLPVPLHRTRPLRGAWTAPLAGLRPYDIVLTSSGRAGAGPRADPPAQETATTEGAGDEGAGSGVRRAVQDGVPGDVAPGAGAEADRDPDRLLGGQPGHRALGAERQVQPLRRGRALLLPVLAGIPGRRDRRVRRSRG